MKPLENQRWFILLSLAISVVLMGLLWRAASLPFTLSAGGAFVFAVLGLWAGVRALLALWLIRREPELGSVG